MKNTMKAKETTTRVRNSSNHWPWWRGLLFIELLLGLAVLAVSPLARAVSPPPDGGYSGLNTAEGTDALFSQQPASPTRPWVLKRSTATPPARQTWRLGVLRSNITPGATTPHAGSRRSGTTRSVSLTQPTGMVRWGATPQATTIRPPAVVRFLAIALAITTPLRVLA